MRTERCNYIKCVMTHRKELIIAGVSVSAIVAILLGYKNRSELLALWSTLEGKLDNGAQCRITSQTSSVTNVVKVEPRVVIPKLKTCIISVIPQEIRSHIRNLPEGWNASAEKLATAAENGYLLLPGQTWVDSYTKNRIAA